MTYDLESAIQSQAQTIAAKAEAIAEGTLIGSRLAAVKLMAKNLETLQAWIESADNGQQQD
jgi:hypothetical protein